MASKWSSPVLNPQRRVVEAILYVLRSGCTWLMLPLDFPPCKPVYQVFYRGRLSGVWERIHEVLRRTVRRRAGKKPTPTAGIIDRQTVKSAESSRPFSDA